MLTKRTPRKPAADLQKRRVRRSKAPSKAATPVRAPVDPTPPNTRQNAARRVLDPVLWRRTITDHDLQVKGEDNLPLTMWMRCACGWTTKTYRDSMLIPDNGTYDVLEDRVTDDGAEHLRDMYAREHKTGSADNNTTNK